MYRILISHILKTNHTQINIQPHSHFLHRSTIFSLSIYCSKNPFPGLQNHTDRGGRPTSLRSRQGSITRVEWKTRIRVCHSGVLPRAAAQCPVVELCLVSAHRAHPHLAILNRFLPMCYVSPWFPSSFTLSHFSSSHCII